MEEEGGGAGEGKGAGAGAGGIAQEQGNKRGKYNTTTKKDRRGNDRGEREQEGGHYNKK